MPITREEKNRRARVKYEKLKDILKAKRVKKKLTLQKRRDKYQENKETICKQRRYDRFIKKVRDRGVCKSRIILKDKTTGAYLQKDLTLGNSIIDALYLWSPNEVKYINNHQDFLIIDTNGFFSKNPDKYSGLESIHLTTLLGNIPEVTNFKDIIIY